MIKQVDKKIYEFFNYSSPGRFASYWYQLSEVLDLKPDSVLEIGAGDKVLGNYLRSNTSINYQSLDLAADLSPDIVGSVDAIPLNDNTFDLVCAFEVLEHLPFEKFEKSLQEMKRVAKQYVLISLPHWGRHFSLEIRLPFWKKIRWQHKINSWPIKHQFNGQHYWEIGKKDYPLERIKNSIRNTGLEIVNDYVPFEMPYHHFFVLKK
jgi:SAM-dependent methyltransferase